MDAAYRAVVPELPAEHRGVAADLPYRLGLTRAPEGGWESFIALPPNRDLPAFAAEPLALPEAVLDRFRLAYFCGVFHGILADRLADRQAPSSPELLALLPALERLWRLTLAGATGDEALAQEAIDAALDAFERGVALEQEALSARALSIPRYEQIIRLKSQWISAPAVCLLEGAGERDRARLFKLAYDLLIVGLQCVDDAVDGVEDERIHGASIPAALGFPGGGLFRASPKITRLARAPAQAGGFAHLDAWLAARAKLVEGMALEGHSLRDELAGAVIAASIEESCPWEETGLPRCRATSWLTPPTPLITPEDLGSTGPADGLAKELRAHV